MFEVKQISYQFRKSKFAVKEISFSLEEGYMMCLLGKNGAGKTTLFQLLYGARKPKSGSVIYRGNTVVSNEKKMETRLQDYHQKVAYVGDVSWCLETCSMKDSIDTLKLFYENFDETEYRRMLTFFELTEKEEAQEYQELSTGQKMQFQLAFALARHPELVLLDEPFANLDPVAKMDLLELLREKMEKEMLTVILSTHLVDEISDAVDYIGLMEDGMLIKFGDREKILGEKHAENLKKYLLGGEADEN